MPASPGSVTLRAVAPPHGPITLQYRWTPSLKQWQTATVMRYRGFGGFVPGELGGGAPPGLAARAGEGGGRRRKIKTRPMITAATTATMTMISHSGNPELEVEDEGVELEEKVRETICDAPATLTVPDEGVTE